MQAAAERSGLDALVRRMPHGYDTVLGRWFERGHELSGGVDRRSRARAPVKYSESTKCTKVTKVEICRTIALFVSFVAFVDQESAIRYSESTKFTKFTKVGIGRMIAIFVSFVAFVDQASRILDRRSRWGAVHRLTFPLFPLLVRSVR